MIVADSLRLRLVVAAWLASACGPLEGERTHRYDEGSLCVNVGPRTLDDGEIAPTQLAEGAPLTFSVTHARCLSASCDINREARCRVTRDGDTLRVQSVLRWEQRGGDCTSDCGRLSAECGSSPLEAGEYTVHFGAKQRVITVPSLLRDPCTE